ncbi:hypothetical protein AB6A40_001080 [Gnathostoma spinigerum]|uniref:Solute carrier family 46 member 3 n=1 Tax=Gnathostoma spinigerum TaxID=75299 RepID=A0ABD6E5K5_9BILA
MENDPLMCDEDSDTSERELASKKYFVNVEPVIFLFSISFGSMLTVQPLFLYWARCTEIFQPITNASDMKLENVSMLCANLSDINNTIYQDIVETDISRTRIFIQMASSIPTLIVAPLMGTWSDGTGGRRAPLVVALVGLLLYCFLHFLATLIYTCVNVYYILFVAEAIIGCCGGFAALFSAALSIVTDDSRDKLIVVSPDFSFFFLFRLLQGYII